MEHETEVLADKIIAGLATLHRPTLPVEIDLWDLLLVAAYFKRDRRSVSERIVCQPSLPKAIRLPSEGKTGTMRALWRATEVIA